MVPDGLTLACDLHCHFLCVLCTEPGSPFDEEEACLQRGTCRSGVQFDADIHVPLSCLQSKSDEVRYNFIKMNSEKANFNSLILTCSFLCCEN
jgi:hypothetical protein